jgi:hypothetical protein
MKIPSNNVNVVNMHRVLKVSHSIRKHCVRHEASECWLPCQRWWWRGSLKQTATWPTAGLENNISLFLNGLLWWQCHTNCTEEECVSSNNRCEGWLSHLQHTYLCQVLDLSPLALYLTEACEKQVKYNSWMNISAMFAPRLQSQLSTTMR